MSGSFIDYELLGRFDKGAFRARQPFPWAAFEHFLSQPGFERLLQNFPALEWFEKHEDLPRGNNQRPHNRFYLAYEKSIYHSDEAKAPGVIQPGELPEPWQLFLNELASDIYLSFVKSLLGVSKITVRYAWHIAIDGCEVSPHRDAENKAGTHIFYFNTSHDWSDEWGGATLVLAGKRTPDPNPEFEDFDAEVAVPFLNNRSYFFQNTANAWHGMRKLKLPEGKQRRIFNVIFEVDQKRRDWSRWFRM